MALPAIIPAIGKVIGGIATGQAIGSAISPSGGVKEAVYKVPVLGHIAKGVDNGINWVIDGISSLFGKNTSSQTVEPSTTHNASSLQADNNASALMMALQQQEASQSSAREAMKFSADQAQLDRDWQERMSNTAYQRAVADMKAAGINPALAYSQGGATTPGGAAATGSTASMAQANVDNDTVRAILSEYMQNQTAAQVASANNVASVLSTLLGATIFSRSKVKSKK